MCSHKKELAQKGKQGQGREKGMGIEARERCCYRGSVREG